MGGQKDKPGLATHEFYLVCPIFFLKSAAVWGQPEYLLPGSPQAHHARVCYTHPAWWLSVPCLDPNFRFNAASQLLSPDPGFF